MRAMNEAFRSIGRRPGRTAVSILAIMLALILFGVFGILTAYAHGFAEKLRKSEEISVYLKDSVSDADMLALDAAVSALDGVESTRIVGKEEASREFERLFGENLLSALEENPLPRTIIVTMSPHHRKSLDFERIGKRVAGFTGVETVEYGREWMKKMDIILSITLVIEIIILSLVGISGILIIANSIGMTVVVRQNAIEIMRLVGATEGYIRRPFYFEGLIQGFIAGVCAFLALYGAFVWLRYSVSNLEVYLHVMGIPANVFDDGIWYLLALIPSGALFGWFGSHAALRRSI